MAYTRDQDYKVSSSDGTTSTLVPVGGFQPGAPTQIVMTFGATPAELAVTNKRVRVDIASDV